MRKDDLAFFALLARKESFNRAARDLGISGSAVSRRLAQLEDRLGVRLMNRTTRRVSLTGEGQAYFAEGLRILGDIEALEQSLTRTREVPSGILRINATLGFSRAFIAPAASAFSRLYPDVEIQLVLSDTPMNLVKEGIDLGIRFGTPPASQTVMRLLHRNRRFMCASPTYLERHGMPSGLTDIQMHNCIVLRQDNDPYGLWRFDEIGDLSPTAKVTGTLSTNDGEIALGWVLGGHGIMLRSEWDISRRVRAGSLRVLLPRYCQTANIAAVYPERHNLSAKVRVFVDTLAAEIRKADEAAPLQLGPGELLAKDGVTRPDRA